MRKLPILTLSLLFLIGCSTRENGTCGSEEYAEAAGKEKIYVKPPNPPVMDVKELSYRPYEEVFNDSNYIQYMSAEWLGIDPITDLSKAYNTRRPLVKLESGDSYVLSNLTHSMPFLVPEAAELLDEIGTEFAEQVVKNGGGKGTRVYVTSVLRSPYSVKKLRRVNANAVDSSTHKFATTFDLSYNNFFVPDSSRSIGAIAMKRVLGEVLIKKRNEGKCFVKYEKKSPCFHITVTKTSSDKD